MQIALIADDQKKELLNQFCIAYCGILSKQRICATSRTGKSVAEATGLDVECLLPASHGGVQQISSRVSYDEVDIVIFFRDSSIESSTNEIALDLLRLCDIHNVPVATNIASAEVIIRDWRELVNPKSDFNLRRRAIREMEEARAAREADKRRRESKRSKKTGL